jgi:hypothetical protein
MRSSILREHRAIQKMPRRAEYSFAPFLLVFCVKSKPEPVAHGEHTRMEVYG